jgi:murein tripeptide amidase MpaA
MLYNITMLVVLALFAFAVGYKSYHGHIVFRVMLETDEQLKALEKLEGEGLVDIWSERAVRGAPHDVRVEPANLDIFTTTMFEKLNTRYEIMIDNVQKLIDNERAETNRVGSYDGVKNVDFFANYRTNDEFEKFLNDLHAAYPKLTTLFTIGKTLMGRDIRGIKITSGDSNAKPAMVFNGGQHAREWVSPMTVAYIANRLLTTYENDPRTRNLVDNLEWHLIPIVNADGYNYTWTNQRLWRKNLRKNAGSSCMGVDTNRNWDYKWDATGGSSTNPCSETYRGPKPFSEPESTAIATYAKNTPNIKGYIDFHSYSQLWMRPWGYTSAAPADEATMKEAGDACAKAIYATHGKEYESGRISITIYEASGSSVDYVYAMTKAISFAVELRPDQSSSYGFLLPASQIVPTGEENWNAAVYTFGEYVLKHQ